MMSSIQATEARRSVFNISSPTNEKVSDGSLIAPQSLTSRQKQRTGKRRLCVWRSCRCSCHIVSRAGSRFWLLELPSLATLWNACDHTSCTRRQHHAYTWIGSTRIGVPFAITASLKVLLTSAKVSISPSLTIERIVKYTSPAFELWRCQSGRIQWPEARKKFEDIVRSGKASIGDINPGGRTLLEARLTIFLHE
jgi:hypothetical protein